MKLKLTYVLILFTLKGSYSYGQYFKMNRLSLDASYGYNQAIRPFADNLNSNFNQLTHFEVGFRYMFNTKYGLRLNYANDRFKNFKDGVYGVNFDRVGLDAVYNLGRLFEIDLNTRSRNVFGLLTHLGVGYTRSKPVYKNYVEQIGAVVVGITPQLRVTERASLFLDACYNANFKQHYAFDGTLLSPNFVPTIGSHYTVAVGIMVYLGSGKYHADWY